MIKKNICYLYILKSFSGISQKQYKFGKITNFSGKTIYYDAASVNILANFSLNIFWLFKEISIVSNIFSNIYYFGWRTGCKTNLWKGNVHALS